MKRLQGLLAGLILALFVAGCGGAIAGRGNDTVYHEDQYNEYFKQEGNGDKNYLYTITEQPAPKPGMCNIYTFASETAGAVACNFGTR